MQNDDLKDMFNDLKGKFDVNEPNEGHTNRFLEKLKANDTLASKVDKPSRFNWKPFLAIAASLVICFGVFMTSQNTPETLDLASVSPELSEAQDFFTVTIENELKRLNEERSPLTEQIINDALVQIELLENDYNNLKSDLTESGKDKRVIYAMITNFQNRIDILTTVLEQIEQVKQLKTNTNETTNTI